MKILYNPTPLICVKLKNDTIIVLCDVHQSVMEKLGEILHFNHVFSVSFWTSTTPSSTAVFLVSSKFSTFHFPFAMKSLMLLPR
jgi:hypothetical protein